MQPVNIEYYTNKLMNCANFYICIDMRLGMWYSS